MPLPSPVADFPDMSGFMDQSRARASGLMNAAWSQLSGMGQQAPTAQTPPPAQAGGEAGSYGADISGYGQNDRAQRLRRGMIDRGLSEHVADGFMMNFQDESGFNAGINEANPTVAGSRGGYGLYQLTGPRRTAYEQYADSIGANYNSEDAQLDFLVHELGSTEASAARRINMTTNAGEAGDAIVRYFLRPAAEHQQSRSARYLSNGNRNGGGN